MKKSILILLTFCVLQACETAEQSTSVEHFGILREIMMQQKLEANANLMDLNGKSNTYALGALEGLSGEILILDGKPLNGLAKQGQLKINRSFDYKATLLVMTQVKDWHKVSLEGMIENNSDLQALVAREAEKRGINTDEAFPFLLKGDFEEIEWHVINAAEATAQNHDAYKAAGLKGKGGYSGASILGFYSNQHEGVFTHHGSYLHMHFVNDEETEMGHVDNLKNDRKVELWLAKTVSK
ncbi:acetolactate decarboxylase [Roseivirga sp. E12]|uniref:acetolactate decarboxylase n=1 Tax=Roseivirga sp. E12 TaxID=2819237 RepID=UPI001ABCA930|nr:acetolactate decarboxylase [Roseivirga sp. E12]MBO3700735.1 acetolactate decarboxylase [Roseivirga sp. E12]